MRAHALKFGRGIRWYLRQVSGEAKWDEYLEHCRYQDVEPITRRDFERHRTQHMEDGPQVRCC